MKKVYILTGLLFFLTFNAAMAQLLPPNQPEQDACNALLLCGNSFTSPYSYQGTGAELDIFGTPCSGGEVNSVWIRLNVNTGGSIVFTITPVSPDDDYDFAVLNVTNVNCNNIQPTNVIRCNFNNNSPGSNVNGTVGLNLSATTTAVTSGSFGNSFCQFINAAAGDSYLIMINNFGNYVSGGTSSGFTIDFSGSTAAFTGDDLPQYDSLATVPCNAVQELTLFLNTDVLCSSVAANGSDFRIDPPLATVIGAAGINCSGGSGYTDEIHLSLSNPIAGGYYALKPQTGTDGNTLLDLCAQEQLLTDSYIFFVPGPLLDLGSDTTICTGDSLMLQPVVGGSGAAGCLVNWSPASYLSNATILNPVTSPAEDIDYVLTLTPAGRPECAVQDTLHITVLQGFDLLTEDTAICRGSELPLNSSGDPRYQYQWLPATAVADPLAASTTTIPAQTTTYTLIASYPGCSDTAQSVTITVDAALPGYVYFTTDRKHICIGETIQFTPHMDVVPFSFSWDFGDENGYTSVFETARHSYDHSGAMPATIRAYFLACPDTSYTDTVFVHPAPLVDLGADSVLCLDGAPIFLRNHAVNPPGYYRYVWNNGDTASTLKVVHHGTYKLHVFSAYDCAGSEEVRIDKDCYVDIPNAFTPNGDGANDYFFPRQLLSRALLQFRMQVFNRWGQQVFLTTSTEGKGWDGMFNGRPQPEGVYLYVIDADVQGKKEHYQGNVTLLR